MKLFIPSKIALLRTTVIAMFLFGFYNVRADCTLGNIDSSTDPLASCSGVVTITGQFTISDKYDIKAYPITEIVIANGGSIVWASGDIFRLPPDAVFRLEPGAQINPGGLCTDFTRIAIDDQVVSCTGFGNNVSWSFQEVLDAAGFDRNGLLPVDCIFNLPIFSRDDPFDGCTGTITITSVFTIDESYNNFPYEYKEVILDGGFIQFTANKFWRLPQDAQLCITNGGYLDDAFCTDGVRIAINDIQISCTGMGGGAPVTFSFDDINSIGEGCVDQSGLLPIELMSFEGKPMEDRVLLTWSTASEFNNDYMAVERSVNGLDYDEIGRVTGKGTSYDIQNYEFSDEFPQQGINYYRLRQVDFDGTTAYHPVISVLFENNPGMHGQLALKAFPNPVSDELQINWSTPASDRNSIMRVFDSQGRMMKQVEIASGGGVYNLPVQEFAPGIYVVQITQGGLTQNTRFVKN